MAKQRLDIEELLIWAYRDQVVDEAKGTLAGPRRSRMGFGMVGDGAGGMDDPHPDAFTVHAAVRRLSMGQAGLVIACAKVAAAPDWYPGARLVMAAVVNQAGHPAGVYDDRRNKIGHRVRAALELETGEVIYGDGEAVMAAGRVEYLAWHEALAAVAAHLRGRLEDFEAYGPTSPRAPWEENNSLRKKVA